VTTELNIGLGVWLLFSTVTIVIGAGMAGGIEGLFEFPSSPDPFEAAFQIAVKVLVLAPYFILLGV
jgi:hypothetical protein